MRVVIITVYNSQNSGSMLQACTLYETVRELGYEVAFLNTHARNLLFDTIKYCGKRILLLKFTQIATQWRVYREFKNFLSPYNIITEKDLDFANDIFILGSDEIWNVRRAEMREYSIFWGSGLPNDRIIAYAPTVNNSRAEDLVKYQMVRNAMENISALSVRDSYSKNVLQKIFKRDIAVVCDPTHLWNRVKYNKWILKVKCVPYILVYGKTNSYSSESIAAIKNFAKEKHLKIISYMFAFSWVDATVRGG